MFTSLSALLIGISACKPEKRALQEAIPKIVSQLDSVSVKTDEWRVHALLLGEPAGSFEIQPYVPPIGPGRSWSLNCSAPCVLIFVDLAPHALFAHPTMTLVYDTKTRELTGPELADWWPLVNGVPVLDSVGKREDALVRLDRLRLPDGVVPPLGELLGRPRIALVDHRHSAHDPVTHGESKSALTAVGAEQLTVRALLVRGYDDLAATFDEDVAGMKTVLLATGVAPEAIETLAPEDGAGDPPLLRQQIKDSIDEIASASPGTCEDFIFFMTSHGNAAGIMAGRIPDETASPAPDWYLYTDLVNALQPAVDVCNRTTVVLETCFGGAFRTAAASSNLVTRVFTTAKDNQYAYGDDDQLDYGNAADSGGEGVWGLIEAFGTSQAETGDDAHVSLAEAFEYAKVHDARSEYRILELTPDSITDTERLHYSWPDQEGGDLEVAFTDASGSLLVDTGTAVQLSRCDPEKLYVRVRNNGTNSIGPAALRVFMNDEIPPKNWTATADTDHNLRSTVMVGSLNANEEAIFEVAWYIPGDSCLDQQTRLVATVDSIGDPLPPPVGFGFSTSVTPENTAELVLSRSRTFWDRLCCLCQSLCSCPQ